IETEQEIINESTNAISRESEEYTTEEEELINENDGQEEIEIENNELRSEILKILKSQKNDESLIANLQEMLKNSGAAREKNIAKEKPKEQKTVSDMTTEKVVTKKKRCDPARNFEWQPSWFQQASKVSEAEPIKMLSSKFLARKTLSDNESEKEDSNSSEEPESENENDLTKSQVKSAMKTLFAAFGPKLKISKAPTKKQADKPILQDLHAPILTSRTTTPEPREPCRFRPTPQTETIT
ncbi:uncharacterized protein LOC132711687, partial [Pantherophis guttatus]|uniref:Uncharacterized protein LOC132711687 n=1 Tax=Pantherophis guttatus TaxID=94885 RepID=A0ABM3ZFM0_PANGU